jgi:thioredoxin reductase (NADPH)
MFIAIGQTPQTAFCKNLVKVNEEGFIIADENCGTSEKGIFAAGDCRVKQLRQLVTAVSDGAVAAVNACRYIDEIV